MNRGDLSAAATGTPTPTDTCGSATASSTDSAPDTGYEGHCGQAYRVVRTWAAVDDCGLSHTQQQTITVVDTVGPTFTSVPAAATVECAASPDLSAATLGSATASDVCGGAVTVSFADGEPTTEFDGQCGDAYQFVRVWTATDAYVPGWTGEPSLA